MSGDTAVTVFWAVIAFALGVIVGMLGLAAISVAIDG